MNRIDARSTYLTRVRRSAAGRAVELSNLPDITENRFGSWFGHYSLDGLNTPLQKSLHSIMSYRVYLRLLTRALLTHC